ncbi:hypothetical protein, partial [Vibrio alginolyticus]|uniref:hypothetical protein n=1 Tax=Vibrio alginolyticus TaxID=663 RepID=UPI001C9CBB92
SETTVSSVIAVYLSVNRSGENNINRLHRNFLSLPYTRNQHSSKLFYSFLKDGKLVSNKIPLMRYCSIWTGVEHLHIALSAEEK